MRRSGVRIPLAPPQTDIRSGCRFFVCLGASLRYLLLCCFVAAGVPGAGGPGRPRDRHTRACGSEWSISKLGQALPSPTGTAARPTSPTTLVSLNPELTTNFACNSPATISNHEFIALEFQRFLGLLNFWPIELHATLGGVGADVSECPTKAYRHPGQAKLSCAALLIDQTGCVHG